MSESLEPVTEVPLFSAYQPVAGVFDELFTPQRKAREHCQPLVNELSRLGRQEIDQASRRVAQLLRDNGVTFNAYDEDGESSRPWQLDILPAMLPRAEFRFLDAALIQRATLLEQILADLFGEQRLLREKVIPPELVFGHPGFHRAFHQLQPAGVRRLTLYAADLARAPDGRWWATGDRTRAPSGLGFVLENRIVMSRVLPGVFRAAGVRRLAPFFAQLRETLRESATRFRDNPRIVLLSRGPDSATYFEDVYLARYLGYTLVEGGDLAVREGRVMLKTLGGLLPIEVVLRRMSDADCDPVELDPASLTGVSGLVDVVRNHNVVVANSLGSRLAETPALVPFLESACRFLLNEDLQLPSFATWWCGNSASLSYVLSHLDQLIIQPAYFIRGTLPMDPSLMTNTARSNLIAQLRARPADFIARERIVNSTTPVWLGENRVEPWHAAFRMFLTADGDSFQTLPGGLARISPDRHSLDRSMTAGQRAQDVWVEADGPVETVSLLTSPDTPLTLMRSGNDLPSRDADNLFWLGRMIERADGSARVLRVVLQRIATSEDDISDAYRSALLRALAALGQIEPGFALQGLQETMPALEDGLPQAAFNPQEARSLKSTVAELSRLADSVRDRLSLDAWRSLSKLGTAWNLSHRRISQLDATGLLSLVQHTINSVALFGGLSNESMTRTQVWRFLELGRRLERVWNTATLLQSTLASPTMPEQQILETILDTCDSTLTYRTRYLANLQAEPVVDLLIADPTNPRSLLYQLERIQEHVSQLPSAGQAVLGPDERLALSLHNAVQLAEPHELCRIELDERPVLDRLMQRLIDQTPRLSDAISQRYLIHAGLPRRFDEE